MGKVDVWMPVYIGDYLKDTEELSAEEHGAYLLLLMHYWQKNGEIGCDVSRLSRVARTSEETARFVLGYYFSLEDGNYKNKRADEEMENAKIRRYSATENGKKGGRPAKITQDKPAGYIEETGGLAKRNPGESSSSSSSPSQEEEHAPRAQEATESAASLIIASWYRRHQKETTLLLRPSEDDRRASVEASAQLGDDADLAARCVEYYWANWREFYFATKQSTRSRQVMQREPDWSFRAFARNITSCIPPPTTADTDGIPHVDDFETNPWLKELEHAE